MLVLQYPEFAWRDCIDCQTYVYDEKTGRRAVRSRQNPAPVPRPKGTYPPCFYGPDRCPKENPDAGKALTWRNMVAYNHYKQCRAVGRFPVDPIVERNAAIIAGVEEIVERNRQEEILLLLRANVGLSKGS